MESRTKTKKTKRAEIEYYRPGALKLKKESGNAKYLNDKRNIEELKLKKVHKVGEDFNLEDNKTKFFFNSVNSTSSKCPEIADNKVNNIEIIPKNNSVKGLNKIERLERRKKTVIYNSKLKEDNSKLNIDLSIPISRIECSEKENKKNIQVDKPDPENCLESTAACITNQIKNLNLKCKVDNDKNINPVNCISKDVGNPIIDAVYFSGDEHSRLSMKSPNHDGTNINKILYSNQFTNSKSNSYMQKDLNVSSKFSNSEAGSRRGIVEVKSNANIVLQKQLFNPQDPDKPVLVTTMKRKILSSKLKENFHIQAKIVDRNILKDDLSSDNTSHKSMVVAVDETLYNIQRCEMDISYFISTNQVFDEFKRVMGIRRHLQQCYRQLILSEIRMFEEKNMQISLWKSLYYNLIEKIRDYILKKENLREKSVETLNDIVDDGLNYFQCLIHDIEQTYDFTLAKHFTVDLLSQSETKNRIRLVLVLCQKIFLSMGDLCRYREQYSTKPDYENAKNWYEKAMRINPKNGRPYNQLAIVSVIQKRSLDVVYYYMRSLMTSNPFMSARDSLVSMFDEVRKKYEKNFHSEKNSMLNFAAEMHDSDSSLEKHTSESDLRREIWIRPDNGTTNNRTLSQTDQIDEKNAKFEQLLKMPHAQVLKRFLTCFLHCHGKLFTGVGLDKFDEVLTETLLSFKAVVFNASEVNVSNIFLLQVMSINMFAVDNTKLKGIDDDLPSASQDMALILSMEMFGVLCESIGLCFNSCCQGYDVSRTEMPKKHCVDGIYMPPLGMLLPPAKIWCDWLLYQNSVWNPPPYFHNSCVDTWGAVSKLATTLKPLESDVKLTESTFLYAQELSTLVQLPEDIFFRGFPLIQPPSQTPVYYFAASNSNMKRAQDWLRLLKLRICLTQFLCGVEPPILKLQKTDECDIFVPALVQSIESTKIKNARRSTSTRSDDCVTSDFEFVSSSDDDDDSIDFSMQQNFTNVELLAKKKKALERRQAREKKIQALLDESLTVVLEVKPRYLVADTNCFIDNLHIVKKLMEKGHYTFMIPLTVLAELDGLSRKVHAKKYGSRTQAVKVLENSASALDFIKDLKSPRFKCVTSQGSVVPANMFSLEVAPQLLENCTNDDKILSCCLHLCSDENKPRPSTGIRRIYREVVLLTDDRNLRLKALARDVPVRELKDFARWAGID